MAWSRECGEVFLIWMVHTPVVVTSNADDCAQVLGRTKDFAPPSFQTAIFNELQPDPYMPVIHSLPRNRLLTAFSPKALPGFVDIINRSTQRLVSNIQTSINSKPGTPLNFTPYLADTTFTILLETALGSKLTPEERKLFQKESNALLTEALAEHFTYPMRRIFAFLGVRKRLFEKNHFVRKFAERLLIERENEKPEEKHSRSSDLLDVICSLPVDNRDQQVSLTTRFAIAGFESSSEAIAWTVFEVCGDESVEAKIVNELKNVLGDRENIAYEDISKLTYLTCVWKETLRLHPASGFLLRQSKRDVFLDGSNVFIPKNSQVGVLIAGAQRSIDRGDEFLPSRWEALAPEGQKLPPKAFLAFSCGPGRCPGQFLAEFEGIFILASLFRNFHMSLSCERSNIVAVSDWVERATGPDPDSCTKNSTWTIPVTCRPRSSF